METQETILARRTVHRYTDAPVPKEVVEQALEAAHHAPNHKLTFPWRFTVVGPGARKDLSAVATGLKGADTHDKRQAIRAKIENPGLLVVVSQVKCDDAFRSQEDYAAVSCAIQNMMLSLWANGFGSKWSTGGLTQDPTTHQILGIDPEKETIVGFVWGGKGVTDQTPPTRPPLSDHVRHLD